MPRLIRFGPLAALALAPCAVTAQDEGAGAPVSFLEDVAPILVENCVGCHNPKKAASRYDMTTYAGLAEGGAMYGGITIEPGDPDLSAFVELIRPDGVPLMPYEADEPLPEDQRMVIERWVAEGAAFDGEDPEADWVALLNRTREVVIPEAYPHPMPITALAFTPDGEHVVTSGYHELNTYAISDGSLVRRTPGMGERTYAVAFGPDGTRLAVAGGDPGQAGHARLWTVGEDGALSDPVTLVEADDTVFAVAFSPDGSRLAVGGADRALRVFDVATGERLAEVEDHADWILDVAWSPDGKRLATASRDGSSKVFDAEAYESLATFPGHGAAVYCVGVPGDDGLVASGGEDGSLRLWKPGTDVKQDDEVDEFDGPIFDLAILDGGEALAACGADAVVRVADPSDGKVRRTLEGHGDWVYRLAVSPDGSTLASGSWDGEVKLWDLADGSLRATILAAPGHEPGAVAARDTDR